MLDILEKNPKHLPKPKHQKKIYIYNFMIVLK